MKNKEIKQYKKQLLELSLTMSVGKVVQLHETIVARLREDGLEDYAWALNNTILKVSIISDVYII